MIKMLNILIVTAIILGSCTQEKMKKYTSENFEISYPETWSKQQKGTAIFFLSPKENKNDYFQENINIMLQDLSSQPMTLEEYTDLTKEQITQALGKSAIISLKDMNFAGQKAKEMIYNMPKNPMAGRNFNLKLHQIWFVKDSKAYLFTYTAEKDEYENYLELAKQTIDSFKLTQ